MIESYLGVIIFIAIIIGAVICFFENRYRQNLFVDKSFTRFKKLKVKKLELKRYIRNSYLSSNARTGFSRSKRKEIPLNSPMQDKIGMFNTSENELTVIAVGKKMSHEVFTCPYCKENVIVLTTIINEFNSST